MRPPERVPEVAVVSREHLPQLEIIQEVHPPGEMRPISAEASRGKSHLNSGTSKGSFTPLLQLKKFPDIPKSPAHIQRSPFPPPSSGGGFLSLRGRERIPGVPVASQEEALSTGKARGTPGSCHHSQSPRDVSVHSRETCFPCTASTFKSRIDSHHGGTWDSPVGKPRGKASGESLEEKPQIT